MTSLTEFFNKHEDDALKGITHKNSIIKRNIIAYMAVNGECTLSELTKELHISVPTITKLVQELVDENIVTDLGKVETPGGRRPNIFGLANSAIYFAGVNVGRDNMRFLITDLQNNIIKEENDFTFELLDRPQCIERICSGIENFIATCGIDRGKILGLGVCMTGRVNPDTGRSYKYFTSSEQSLRDLLEERVGIRVLLENDTRARCYAEYTCGKSKDESNVLYLHMGRGVAIGIVVDDAIVVVEAVERIMNEEGLSPYEATKKAMSGLGSAIIATSLVLCAVFVPVSFLSGITGQLYRQFTITIAVSVLISTFVALTLSPALCALILRPDSGKRKNRLFRRINIWLGSGTKFYERMIRGGVRHSKRMLALFGLTLVALWALNKIVPQSFMPQEDQGYFTVELELPEGATLERTRRVTDRAMKYLMSLEDVEYVLNVTGSSPRVGTNQSRSQLTVILKPWEERKSSNIRRLMNDIREEMRRYPESKVYLSTPPVIPGLGASGGFEMVLEARGNASYGDLQRAVDTLLHYASKRKELTGLSSSMQSDIPQLYFDVDRDKAQMLGVPMADIFSTMKTFTGSVYVNDFNMFNRIYRVYIQAEAPYRAQRENLGLFFVRGADKAMIPITALGTTPYTTGPGTIRRFNMFNAATISGEAAQGYSSGQAMAILEQIARRHLPSTIGVEWSGLSYQEKHVSGQTGYVLALAFLFVFLFLAAQYESWSVPVAVILSLPVAGIGAYLGIWICGLENNIYFQIGLVMLVGLVAKNAILIVEFAKDEVEKGRDILTAVILAARLRFRPIVMTSLAFILGMVPLVLASGPGSSSRQDIGTGVFFGMIVAIIVGIVLVPFFFVMIHKFTDRLKKKRA